MFKKYIRTGLAVIIPVALVYQVSLWIYNLSYGIVDTLIPFDLLWWMPLVSILGIVIIILLLGMLFELRIFQWFKGNIEKHIINRIPFVRNIYNFGKDISNTFITETDDVDDMSIVEVYMGSITMLGVLTDPKNSLVFVVSAPSPLTGFVMKTSNYKIIDMKFTDLVQINTSLGRINGSKWRK